jgi:predicted ATPase
MSLLDEPQALVAQLVEREAALDELEAAFERAFVGQGCLAVVTAEAGGGKTALIGRFYAVKAG